MRRALQILGVQASLIAIQVSDAMAADQAHGDTTHHVDAVAAHGEAAVAHGENAGLPQMDPEWFASQLFWLAITFVVLYVIFAKKVLPEYSGILETRRSHIQDDLDAAQKLKDEADSVQAAYEEALLGARQESSDLFITGEEKIKAKAAKKQDEFRKRSMEHVRDLEKEIEESIDKAMEEISTIAAEVATEAAEKIVGIRADVKQAKTVVENINKKAA